MARTAYRTHTRKEPRTGDIVVTCTQHGEIGRTNHSSHQYPWTAAQAAERNHRRSEHRLAVTL